jgi:Domain of unknown function (DUF4411)
MKRYCFDTSGISHPLEKLPIDIYDSIWAKVSSIVSSGHVAVTTEIFAELELLPGPVGAHLKASKSSLVLEIGDPNWPWQTYIERLNALNAKYHSYISEYSGNSPRTICLTDMTIVAMAATLGLPVVSMEASVLTSPNKRRIPDICSLENIKHLEFNDFLRAEGIRA